MDDVLDKRFCTIMTCEFSDIRHVFKQYHYKGDSIGGGISVCFAMLIKGDLVGGSVLGKPRHEKKYVNCVDIRRMALIDNAPKNSESWFLSRIIRWIASNTDYNYVLSYSDSTVGHVGTIYRASNFINIGNTSPTKYITWNGKTYHPRSLSIDRPYSYELRMAVESGDAIIHTGLPKTIWLYEISRKLKRKRMDVGSYSKGAKMMSLFDTYNIIPEI